VTEKAYTADYNEVKSLGGDGSILWCETPCRKRLRDPSPGFAGGELTRPRP
jgi:hypothetical protein